MPLDPTLGQIIPAAFTVVPNGWAVCNGQTMQIVQHQALYALLGTQFGGDGIRTFQLPDLRGRVITGVINQTQMGQSGGSPTVTLTLGQMPYHAHVMVASTTSGTSPRAVQPQGLIFGTNTLGNPTETIFALAGSAEVPVANGTNVQYTGGGQAHENMQPYLTIAYLIAVQGIFPSHL